MKWTLEQHLSALQAAKEQAERWNISALRLWSRTYTRQQYASIDEQSKNTSDLTQNLLAFDNSFYAPVFMNEYIKLGGIQA